MQHHRVGRHGVIKEINYGDAMNYDRNDLIDKTNSCFMGCLPAVFGIAVAGRVVWFSVIAFLKGPQGSGVNSLKLTNQPNT
jgi:hypothetical protein